MTLLTKTKKLAWDKMLLFKGKYCVKRGGQSGSVLLHVHEIPISVFWSAGSSYAFSQTSCTNHCLCKEERIHLFSDHRKN